MNAINLPGVKQVKQLEPLDKLLRQQKVVQKTGPLLHGTHLSALWIMVNIPNRWEYNHKFVIKHEPKNFNIPSNLVIDQFGQQHKMPTQSHWSAHHKLIREIDRKN